LPAPAQDCGPGEAPDVIVSDLFDVARWGAVGGISAYSIGTYSCNLGSCPANWIPTSAEHPIIAQNLFRFENGRFEQIGQSWNPHAFVALATNECGVPNETCVPPGDGTRLGVYCADPISASINGQQRFMGPKSEVNAATGEFVWPYTGQGLTGDAVYKRLQARTDDLDPGLHPDAQYFIEAQYVTRDDAAAGNQNNNTSHREVIVLDGGGGPDLFLTGETQRERPAILAWPTLDPGVKVVVVDVPEEPPGCSITEGRCARVFLGARVTDLGGGRWRYEYAIQNLTSDRSIGAFTVPLPETAQVTNVGFHDVDYHSGEPYDGTDWPASVSSESIGWATVPFGDDPDANALRWGTLYNFRFDARVPPGAPAPVELGLFKPGSPGVVTALASYPALCTVGQDVDGDTFGDCDCDDGDPGVWGVPGEVLDLRLARQGQTGTALTWSAPAQLGGTGSTFETVRSTDPSDFVTSATCLDDAATDPDAPGPGELWAYLVRARSGCPLGGAGTLGSESNGVEREGIDCP
jgi:hypothetical protein